MLLIKCPFCGARTETEFIYGGPVGQDRPDPATCSDEVWLDYLLNVPNPVGPVEERWWHARGCGVWFTHWRNTLTHEITEGPDG
ncbi:MAG: sarcosine oxidase subunit delta [Silicimonas sp.]|nr:sarcosine oxidase subunit delta [Silicimonas sp.]